MIDAVDTLVGITIAEHDAERGYAEQIVCSDVETGTLYALAKIGGLSRIVDNLDELATLADGLERSGHESRTASLTAKALVREIRALAQAVRK